MKENQKTKERLVCSECGAVLTETEAHEHDGKILCPHCLDEFTALCTCCGRRVWYSEAETDGDTVLCQSCYDYSYTRCEGCGRIISNDNANYDDDDEYPYCDACYERMINSTIRCYNYKPEPIFYGKDKLYYGVEVEVDKGGEYRDNAQILLDTANSGNEMIYIKHDGSINEGFEIVSHPMTLDYHENHMNWLEVFEKAIEMGYRSHNTSTCGLHIHVSRSAFGRNYADQEVAIARIVYFVEHHWNELLKFSRRTEASMNHWASRYGISENTQDTYKKAKDKHMGRYVAVNLENYGTVEFRIFRGSLRYKTFIAALQLVDTICRLAIGLSDKELENMSWSDFVLKIGSDKPELTGYLKEKRLYVNEIAEEGVEA